MSKADVLEALEAHAKAYLNAQGVPTHAHKLDHATRGVIALPAELPLRFKPKV